MVGVLAEAAVGASTGARVGAAMGARVGAAVGARVGETLGSTVGEVGSFVGPEEEIKTKGNTGRCMITPTGDQTFPIAQVNINRHGEYRTR